MPEPTGYPGTPRWVKLSAAACGILALLALILMLAGGDAGRHGPSRHPPSSTLPQPAGEQP